MQKVSIWGFWYGNYGDDAMTLHVANAVSQSGHQPCVFGLPENLAQRYGVTSADTFEALLHGASVCLLVSGGILTNFHMPFFVADIALLRKECERIHCPIHAVSIGGQGGATVLCREREALFRSESFYSATVRLPSDVPTLRQFTSSVEYFPDMVLSIDDSWPRNSGTAGEHEVHVGFNSSQDFPDTEHQIVRLLAQNPHLVLHFLNNIAASNSHCRSDLMPVIDHPRVKLHKYVDPGETVRIIETLDVMVTHKLHLGVTALAYGVPFLSYGGSPKVRAFLDDIGLSSADVGGTIETSSLARLLPAAMNYIACGPLTSLRLDKAKQLSRGHLKALASIFDKVA